VGRDVAMSRGLRRLFWMSMGMRSSRRARRPEEKGIETALAQKGRYDRASSRATPR